MSPAISHNTSASNNNPVQSVHATAPRARGERALPGEVPAAAEGPRSASAIVKINPAARERAQADRTAGTATSAGASQTERTADTRSAARASRPAGAPAAAGSTHRVPTHVSAALRAYGANQPTATATSANQATQTIRNQDVEAKRSTSAANDPTGLTNTGRTKPTRASVQETAALAEQDQLRQQRNRSANLQGASTSTARLGNQAASVA
ncbi:MAG: hypothetical protein K2W33_10845 [Burkholderiales bacterium]|nr:hypothetical protein [Burkholderiales bacterium]